MGDVVEPGGRPPARPRVPVVVQSPALPPLDVIRAHFAARPEALARLAGSKPPITSVLPQPEPVSLGGETLVVGQLTLSDLALLQQWLEKRSPDPRAGLPPPELDPDPGTRPRRLREALAACKGWPVRLHSREGSQLLHSPEGMAYFLWVVARRWQDVSPRSCLALLQGATLLEVRAVERVAWGVTPRDEIEAELEEGDDPSPGVDWAEQFTLVSETTGWTFQQLGDLTVGQWRAFCTGGKPRKAVSGADLVTRKRTRPGAVAGAN